MRSLLAILAGGLLALATPAYATLQISADIGGTTFFCADNTGCDTNGTVGVLQIADQTINGVQVNGSIQTATAGSTNILNTSSLSLINGNATATAINFVVSATNFLGPISQFATAGSGVFQNAIGSTLTLNWFDDPANAQGADSATDTPGTLIDTFTKDALLAADSFSHNGAGSITDAALFSMTEQAIGTLAAGGQLLNRGQTEIKPQAVPEPGSLFIFGGALLALGLVLRRGQRRSRQREEMRGDFLAA